MPASLPCSTTMPSYFHSAPTSGKLGRCKWISNRSLMLLSLRDVKTQHNSCNSIQLQERNFSHLMQLNVPICDMSKRTHIPTRLCSCPSKSPTLPQHKNHSPVAPISSTPLPIDDCCILWRQGNFAPPCDDLHSKLFAKRSNCQIVRWSPFSTFASL